MNVISMVRDSSLTELDWRVVEIARADGRKSQQAGSRISSFIKKLAQHRIRREPASGKLEVLRRFCERAWYCDRIPVRDLWAFAEAGYSWNDAQQILALVAAQRGFSPTIEGYRG